MKPKYILITVGIIALLIIIACIAIRKPPSIQATVSFASGTGTVYSYGSDDLQSIYINGQGDKIYLPYFRDHKIIEVDTASMQQINSFDLDSSWYPSYIVMSPDDTFLYVTCYGQPNSGLMRINTTNGQITGPIALSGACKNLAINPAGSRLWAIHRTWPLAGDGYTDPDYDAPLNTGLISEIDTASFQAIQSISIPSVPESIWFSPSSSRLFVLHALSESREREVSVPPDSSYSYLEEMWERITIYDASMPGRIVLVPEELKGGGHSILGFYPAQLSGWSDSGEYLAIPNLFPGLPQFSMRVANTQTLTTFDLIFPDIKEEAMGTFFSHKVLGQNTVWAAMCAGKINPDDYPVSGNIALRVSTVFPYDYQPYAVNEAPPGQLGDFAVSPDGQILYMTVPTMGRVIKWFPDDTAPVCSVSASPTTYVGPSPGVITFNASQSYDPDQGDTIGFSWDFNNDGTFGDSYDSGTDSQPVKNFTQDYSGTISVRVTDNHSAHSDCSVNVMIDIT
jgi:hypothetical protein